MTTTIFDFSWYVIAAFTFLMSLVTVIGAFRSGVLKKLRLGSFEFEASPKEVQAGRDIVISALGPQPRELPFETEQLARYYAQVLAQSKISFWFSLVFASIGFFVIVLAAFRYQTAETGSTVVQFTAGVIIDAISALFFVQSRNAQAAMSEFFEKLRLDRQKADAQTLCDSVSDTRSRDALRIQLSLYYSGVSNPEMVAKTIYDSCSPPKKDVV